MGANLKDLKVSNHPDPHWNHSLHGPFEHVLFHGGLLLPYHLCILRGVREANRDQRGHAELLLLRGLDHIWLFMHPRYV